MKIEWRVEMRSMKSERFQTRLRRAVGVALLAVLVIGPGTSCLSNNDDDSDDDEGEGFLAAINLFVSNNGAANSGTIDTFDEVFASQSMTFNTGGNQGLESDIAGNMYQAGDLAVSGGSDGITTNGGVVVFNNISGRTNNTFDASLDRFIGGPNSSQSGLTTPKGVAFAHLAGFMFVADNGGGNVKVFGTACGGDVPPLTTTALGGNPWDLAYDEITDRLFVAVTNGTIEIFDGYILNGFGPSGASRVVTPSDGVAQISTNLHGIAYDFDADAVIVTDVGAANSKASPSFASDGSIYVFFGGTVIDGMVVPDRSISGPSTLLGNPVDCLLVDDSLYVAEKANDFLLRFDNIFSGMNGDVSPNQAATQIKPESVEAQTPGGPTDPDVTDIDMAGILVLSIGTTSNPGAVGPATGEFALITTDLGLQLGNLDLMRSLENVTFDATGDAFVTFDDGSNMNGGIYVVNRLSRARGPVTDSRDREITGGNTLIVSPKGIDVSGDRGLMFVAENNATTPAILVFGTQAHGNAPPAFSTDLTAVGRPWDLDYDPGADRLFVALTNGSVAVFDNYAANQGNMAPSRTIMPSNGMAQVSVNLHGIVHDAATDALLLSDVGMASSPTDGQIFVLPNASTANGLSPVTVQIGGPNSMLGNPVDVTFDGANLYVAEKSNGVLLRFDGIHSAMSGDVAPSQMIARDAPESVALIPSSLSRTPNP